MVFKKFVKGEDGQAITEYGLLLGLIAIAAVASILILRDEIVEMINRVIGIATYRNDPLIDPPY